MTRLTVDCPMCKTKVPWDTSNQFRPFCSERCKLIDLGEWAEGRRSIPSDADHDDTTARDLDRD